MRRSLSFRQDGTFTIVQFTDLHWMNGKAEDQRTRSLMERVIDAENPDLVVFTGDIIYTGEVPSGTPECEHPERAFRDAVAAVEERGIAWAAVFGNHDTERRITRDELMQIALEHRHTVIEPGPKVLPGTGNYILQITGPQGDPAAHLYLLDSGSYSRDPRIPGYDWISREQINWLASESERLNSNGKDKLPALAFFHIPLPEYREVWETQLCYGHKHEQVCSPAVNSGMFAALLEMGDVVGTFCGHDHINDFRGDLHGISLCYGRATGYHTYGKEGFPRGARIIRLRLGQHGFETWLRLEDGTSLQQPAHIPEVTTGKLTTP